MELLKGSVAMQEQVLACKGFLVIGYSLEKVSAEHIWLSGGGTFMQRNFDQRSF